MNSVLICSGPKYYVHARTEMEWKESRGPRGMLVCPKCDAAVDVSRVANGDLRAGNKAFDHVITKVEA